MNLSPPSSFLWVSIAEHECQMIWNISGQFGSAVLHMSLPKLLPTPTLLAFSVGMEEEEESLDLVQGWLIPKTLLWFRHKCKAQHGMVWADMKKKLTASQPDPVEHAILWICWREGNLAKLSWLPARRENEICWNRKTAQVKFILWHSKSFLQNNSVFFQLWRLQHLYGRSNHDI